MKPIVKKKIQGKTQFLKSYPGVVAPPPFLIKRIRSSRIIVKEKVVRRGSLNFFIAPTVSIPSIFLIGIRRPKIVVKEKVVRRGTIEKFLAPPVSIPMLQVFIRRSKIWPLRKRIRQAAGRPIYPRFFNTGLGPVISAVYDFIISARRRRGR